MTDLTDKVATVLVIVGGFLFASSSLYLYGLVFESASSSGKFALAAVAGALAVLIAVIVVLTDRIGRQLEQLSDSLDDLAESLD